MEVVDVVREDIVNVNLIILRTPKKWFQTPVAERFSIKIFERFQTAAADFILYKKEHRNNLDGSFIWSYSSTLT